MIMNYEYIFKFIIIGDTCVGKTSLIDRFISNKFTVGYDVTIGVDFSVKVINIVYNKNTIPIKIQIWDTAGQEIFRSIIRSYYRNVHASVLCFDVTNRTSFMNVEKWMNELKYHTSNFNNLSIILIATKTDMSSYRQVTYEEGYNLAKKHDIEYIEVSSKLDKNIYTIFDKLAINIYKKIDDNKIQIEKAGNKNKTINIFGKERKKELCCK